VFECLVDRWIATAVRRGCERVAAQAMAQREVGGAVDVGVGHLGRAVQRGERARRMRADEVTAHAVKLQAGADRGDPQQLALADRHRADQRASRRDALGERALRVGPRRGEGVGRRVEVHAPAHDP